VKLITILIPTFRRPESLARALKSVFSQERADLIAEIIVVDNSAEGSAEFTVDALRSASPAPLLYVHAQPAGVATARNAGLAAAHAPYVAFLDDDEEAHPIWLGALFSVHTRFSADVTFGPVEGRAAEAAAWKRPYLERFFSRVGPSESGVSAEVYGCGNSMMTRSTALKGPAPFDVAANDTGGEDDRLFTDLQGQGARFAWAADAVVEEHAPSHRAKLRYTLARALSYGQSPVKICLMQGDLLGAVKWMAIGFGQLLVFGAASLALAMLMNRAWIDMADRAARGLGKILWFNRLYFYGKGVAGLRAASPAPADRNAGAGFAADVTTVIPMKSL
jgi:succinoglycan biosynthesis protein ExoM